MFSKNIILSLNFLKYINMFKIQIEKSKFEVKLERKPNNEVLLRQRLVS